MDDFNFDNLKPLIFLIIGIVSFSYSIFKKSKKQLLKTTGEKVEGIVFKLDKSSGSFNNNYSNVKDVVTVRFVTKDQKWITETVKQDFAIFYTMQYKEGQKVDVYYDLKDPLNFYIDLGQSEIIGRLVFGILGFIFIGIGLYQILTK
jgi:hypothetical protein